MHCCFFFTFIRYGTSPTCIAYLHYPEPTITLFLLIHLLPRINCPSSSHRKQKQHPIRSTGWKRISKVQTMLYVTICFCFSRVYHHMRRLSGREPKAERGMELFHLHFPFRWHIYSFSFRFFVWGCSSRNCCFILAYPSAATFPFRFGKCSNVVSFLDRIFGAILIYNTFWLKAFYNLQCILIKSITVVVIIVC